MAGEQRFYEEGEAEEILRRALHQTDVGAVGRDRLLAMASELGISETALAMAEAELEAEREGRVSQEQEARDRLAFRKQRRRELSNGFSGYLTFCAIMTGLWWFTGHGYYWPGWLVGIATVGIVVTSIENIFGDSEKDFEKWRRKKYKVKSVPAEEREAITAYLDEVAPEPSDQELTTNRRVREKFGLTRAEASEEVEAYYRRKKRDQS